MNLSLLYVMRLNLQQLFFILHVLSFCFVNVNAPKKQDRFLVCVNLLGFSDSDFTSARLLLLLVDVFRSSFSQSLHHN